MNQPSGSWTPPEGLGYSSPRPVRLTWRGKASVVLTVVILAGAAALGIFLRDATLRDAEVQRLLREEGRTAEATVTRAWMVSSKERQNWIAYRFAYGGSIYSHDVQAPTEIWQGFREGSVITVRFVPSQPSISHPVAWDAKPRPPWLAWVMAGIVAVPALILQLMLRRQMRLLAEGTPACGRITRVRRTNKGIRVRYEFRLPSNIVMQGKDNVFQPPAEGAAVCVLYDPDNPGRNAIYPLAQVRLETRIEEMR